MPTPIGDSFTPTPRARKYDFHALGVTDGRVWLLRKGRDYACTEQNLRQHVRTFAHEHGLRFGFQVIREGKRVLGAEVAFTPHGGRLPGEAVEPHGERFAA
jgi:hypothetical protein